MFEHAKRALRPMSRIGDRADAANPQSHVPRTGLRTCGRVAALAVAGLLLAPGQGAAADCEASWMLTYSAVGNLFVAVNGAPVHRGGSENSYTGGAPIGHWLKAGENEVKIRLSPIGSTPVEAHVEAARVCRGQMVETQGGNPGKVAEIALDKAGAGAATFQVDTPPSTPYDAAVVTDGAGVEAAVRKLQAAFKAGDVDTIVAMHAPMIAMAEKMGMRGAAEQFRGLFAQNLAKADLAYVDQLKVTPALDGKVQVASGPDDASPIDFRVKSDRGSLIFDTGIFWAKLNGEWLVISR